MAKKKTASRPRIASLVRMMSTLPFELVHQILDDLTIYNILLLASHSSPSLDDRIYSYLVYRELIEGQHDFLPLREYFEVYSEIFAVLGLQKCPPTSPLATSLSTRRVPPRILNQYMHDEIFTRLRTSIPFISLLKPFTQSKLNIVTSYTTNSELRAYWQDISEAEKHLNSAKAAQLRRIADILETHPDLVYQASDTRKVPIANASHLVRRLRTEAEKTSRSNVLRPNKYSTRGLPSAWLFWPNFVPIVPLDSTLKLFLKGMRKYPPSPDELASASNLLRMDARINDGMKLLELDSEKYAKPKLPPLSPFSASSAPETKQPYHKYPTPVLRDLCIAIKGFAYVYMPPAVWSISPVVNVSRTQHTPPSSTAETRYRHGFSLLDNYQDKLDTSTISQLKAVKGTPHDEREFEWLETFLRCCRHLAQLGMEA
ncbi:hypothetical protein ACJ73_02363 [Blastomyces percursus]|uniref:Uncharacterized protein n=1 Tax=Blastomyces percursus TaxID=1658174 RepID=A0A1J9RF38_9EURO|nr:hypothetical protein ACJ73_02363 [Blastomyces percursus]